ncbi:hypothetical protein QBC47DRAFT_357404 [Echria macrotheca]|uniref:Uncharacterized protein n=1 Tax=Echria macrotheca TaxID=438768 RepID=A0AAJ0BJR7_9PEZI|nr:hypothetical protein QBC47DRAFT_357404 [Echria macrotheca]
MSSGGSVAGDSPVSRDHDLGLTSWFVTSTPERRPHDDWTPRCARLVRSIIIIIIIIIITDDPGFLRCQPQRQQSSQSVVSKARLRGRHIPFPASPGLTKTEQDDAWLAPGINPKVSRRPSYGPRLRSAQIGLRRFQSPFCHFTMPTSAYPGGFLPKQKGPQARRVARLGPGIRQKQRARRRVDEASWERPGEGGNEEPSRKQPKGSTGTALRQDPMRAMSIPNPYWSAALSEEIGPPKDEDASRMCGVEKAQSQDGSHFEPHLYSRHLHPTNPLLLRLSV